MTLYTARISPCLFLRLTRPGQSFSRPDDGLGSMTIYPCQIPINPKTTLIERLCTAIDVAARQAASSSFDHRPSNSIATSEPRAHQSLCKRPHDSEAVEHEEKTKSIEEQDGGSNDNYNSGQDIKRRKFANGVRTRQETTSIPRQALGLLHSNAIDQHRTLSAESHL